MTRESVSRYSGVTQALHWMTAVLVVLAFTYGPGGSDEISAPFASSHDLGASVASIHTWLGDAILWVAGLHALAAIYHHVVLRDGVLASMLPRWIPLKHPARP